MNKLEIWYKERVTSTDPVDFLRQVGHTENGKSITNIQFNSMVKDIRILLDLKEDDYLLDLCCGNGFITKQLAQNVREVTGVDLSKDLINIAKEKHQADNISYHVGNVRKLNQIVELQDRKYTKVIMHAALQHFPTSSLEFIIKSIEKITVEDPTIVFGFVTEKNNRGKFYDTHTKKFDYIVRRLTGRDVMGSWWDRDFISNTCLKHNFLATFYDIDSSLRATNYRFNVRIVRNRVGLHKVMK